MTAGHELLPWHRAEWPRWAGALASGRLASALLLTGAPGIGKRHFAGVLMRAVLCASTDAEGLPCGACRSCVQVAAGSHPDMAALEPDQPGGSIKIAQIRGFVHRLYLTAQYGHGRVGYLDPAERLTAGAANALLKALEEPPAGSHILLVTDRPRALLATIRSRCQIWRCRAPASAPEAWLAQAPTGTAAMLPLARGAPLLAASLAAAGVPQAESHWCAGLAALASGKQDPVALADDWLQADTGALLDWLYLACSELLTIASGGRVRILRQHAKPLASAADALDREQLRRTVPQITTTRRLLSTPVDKRLALESLCIALFDCRRTGPKPRV